MSARGSMIDLMSLMVAAECMWGTTRGSATVVLRSPRVVAHTCQSSGDISDAGRCVMCCSPLADLGSALSSAECRRLRWTRLCTDVPNMEIELPSSVQLTRDRHALTCHLDAYCLHREDASQQALHCVMQRRRPLCSVRGQARLVVSSRATWSGGQVRPTGEAGVTIAWALIGFRVGSPENGPA